MTETGKRVLVTGATGNVGAEVMRLLAGRGRGVRAAVRRPGESAVTGQVEFDFGRPETFGLALVGIRGVFLVRPPALSDVKRYIAPFVDAVAAAGAGPLVFLSLLGAEKNRAAPHHKIERHVEASGVPFTHLRAGFFMQNLTTEHRNEIRLRDEIFVPAGRGKTSFIDVRDIAAVGVAALVEAGHEGKAYDLTGGEALDYFQVAEMLSSALGRRITYRRPGVLRFAWRKWQEGTPLGKAVVMSAVYSTARLGLAARLTDDVERVVGRRPGSMERFVEEHRGCWV